MSPSPSNVPADVQQVSRCRTGTALIGGGSVRIFPALDGVPGVKLRATDRLPFAQDLQDAGYREIVDIPDFCLDKREVTIGEYFACVKEGACPIPDPTPLFLDHGFFYPEGRRHTFTIMDRTAKGKLVPEEYLDVDRITAGPYVHHYDGGIRELTKQGAFHLPDGGNIPFEIEKLCPIDPASNDGVIMPWKAVPAKSELAMSCLAFEDAAAFCQRRGGRLPTTLEWERAAHLDDGAEDVLPWGRGRFESRTGPFPMAAPAEAYDADMPPGSHPADVTPEGVLDLYGNVMEWTDSSALRPLVDGLLHQKILAPGYVLPKIERQQLFPSGKATFAMGRPDVDLRHGWKDPQQHFVDRFVDVCDLCKPTLHDHGPNPYIGFRCAYAPSP